MCYAGYQWFLLKLQAEIETQLDRLEEERKEKERKTDIEPEDRATAANSPHGFPKQCLSSAPYV